MIDINELRQSLGAVQPEEVAELLDRLEAAEKELESWRGLAQQLGNEVGALRFRFERRQDELNQLRANLESAEKERDALRARIDEMEKQEPVGRVHRYGRALNGSAWLGVAWNPEADELPTGTALYALPGAQPAPIIPEGWKPIPEKHPTFDLVDLRLADGSVLCGCVPQSDGDYWWNGTTREIFIDPRYAPATHWRLAATTEARP